MKIHIGILTSSDAKKAQRAMNSALAQKTYFPEVMVSIIVNSTKGYYFDEVVDLVREECDSGEVQVVETDSNGKPGMGKNSAFDYMMESEADYYMLIDGDDFLYPTALLLLKELMDEGYDLVSGLAQDIWTNDKMTGSWNDNQQNNAIVFNRDIMPNTTRDLWTSYSIDRIYCVSHSFLTGLMPKMPEHLDLYEDFMFTIDVTKLAAEGRIKYAMVNHSGIYGYDATGDSQCSIFTTDRKLAQWNMDEFWAIAQLKAPIKFSENEFRKLKHPDGFGRKEKEEYYNIINTAHEAYSRTE